jgi:NADH:ubiquinone reductase (non-electrogenic)
MQPIRYITRFKSRVVSFLEAECISIDHESKEITIKDISEIAAETPQILKYDYLIIGCGAKNATFGIPGVQEYACFLKEIPDARKIRSRLIDCLETAVLPGQSEAEIDRLLHLVIVGIFKFLNLKKAADLPELRLQPNYTIF